MPFNRIRTIGQFIRGCFKKKKQMKIKFGGKSLANGEASIQFKISRVKKQEENYRGFSKRKSN
jgi:hypothetical protein